MWPAWTDPTGTAHVRKLGTGTTYCGKKVGPYTNAVSVRGCDKCVHRDAAEAQMEGRYASGR